MDAQTSAIPNSVQRTKGRVSALSPNGPQFNDIDGLTSTESVQGSNTPDDLSPMEEPSIFTVDEKSWGAQTVLSIDGGGVRGFASLLLLQELMNEIGILERAADPNAVSSAYSPGLDFRTDDEKQLGYKPCHYFDYIGGTNSGGLSAIMLGRLRMTIEATMREYEILSAEVFTRPPSRLKRLLGIRSSAARRESLRKIFVSLNPEQPSLGENREKLTSDSFRCKTIVCSIQRSQKKGFRMYFLFRSYDHEKKSCSPDERNPRSASNFDIQAVASAVSGEPSLFRCFEVRDSWCYDGAVDLNNPSWEVYNEVNLQSGGTEDSINLLLSIGGGNRKDNKSKSILGDKTSQRNLSDVSDHIDRKLSDESDRQNFSYYRLDVDQDLQEVDLNEWEPETTGETTLKRVRVAFRKYLQDDIVQGKIHRCAQELVRIRTLRAKTMRWEAFATGVRYYCPICSCRHEEKSFGAQVEMLDHLRMDHGKPPPDIKHYQEIQALLDAGRCIPVESGFDSSS